MSSAVGGSWSCERSQLWCFPVFAGMNGGNYKLKKLHPTLDVRLAFAYFDDLLETLVIRVNQEEHAQYVATRATSTPYDASGFEFHASPVPFITIFCSNKNRPKGSFEEQND